MRAMRWSYADLMSCPSRYLEIIAEVLAEDAARLADADAAEDWP